MSTAGARMGGSSPQLRERGKSAWPVGNQLAVQQVLSTSEPLAQSLLPRERLPPWMTVAHEGGRCWLRPVGGLTTTSSRPSPPIHGTVDSSLSPKAGTNASGVLNVHVNF